MTAIRLGTRGSALALWQSRWVAGRLQAVAPDVRVELVEITSTGDQITDVPLSEVEGTGFFTSTLERALAAGQVDVAVHSYKDLPVDATPGLVVAAVPERGPVEDVLCVSPFLSSVPSVSSVADLPSAARVGTCSTRRTAQLRAKRPDLAFHPLRGNVPTRIGTLATGELDAIVLARAGLVRLGLEAHITAIFPASDVLPAPAQGALAVQCRAVDTDLRHLLAALDDTATRMAVDAERTLLHALGGGCSVPVGAFADVRANRLHLQAGVFALDDRRSVRVEVTGDAAEAAARDAARQLIDAGAGDILASFDVPLPSAGVIS